MYVMWLSLFSIVVSTPLYATRNDEAYPRTSVAGESTSVAGVTLHEKNVVTASMVLGINTGTFPANDGVSTTGLWNVYPFFESGNIVLSDIQRGLFIVKKKE